VLTQSRRQPSPEGVHATEVIVGTEISGDGVDFEHVDCEALEL
jgi:hypothetical protein